MYRCDVVNIWNKERFYLHKLLHLLIFQFDDNQEEITKFLVSVVDIVDKKLLKMLDTALNEVM